MAFETQSEPRAGSREACAGMMTYQEFLNWPGDNHHVEWVNGRMVSMSPVTDDGIYRVVPIGGDGIYPSKVLGGLWLKVEWLWQPLPPPIMDVLRQWKL